MGLSHAETKTHERIVNRVRNLTWRETRELGLNAQQVLKIRKGEPVTFQDKTFIRLKDRFGFK